MNASTRPAPIPREAPVTIAVFAAFAICSLPLASISYELQNLAFSLLRVCLQGPQLFEPAEEPQIIRLPVPSTPSRFRQSSAYSGPPHLQRYRRCRTFPARVSSRTISRSLFRPARAAEPTLEMLLHRPPCLSVLRA